MAGIRADARRLDWVADLLTAVPPDRSSGRPPCKPDFRNVCRAESNVGFLSGIEGVRALAVLGVILYHSEIAWLFPGGFLGVDIFFTVSGFLITALLVREFRARGSIAVGAFYMRRVRRLMPAVLALLAFAVLAGALVAPDTIRRLRGDVPAALTYTSNWWQIASGQSYFEMIGRPALLQHLWSLAIEEQFYLVWPVLALLIMRTLGFRWLTCLSLGLAALVTCWMAWLAVQNGFPTDADPSRAYLGTDTHTMGLLVGAALGSFWNPWLKPFREDAPAPSDTELVLGLPTRPLLDAVGVFCIAALIGIMATVHEKEPLLYRGGFLALSIVSSLLIFTVADRRAGIGRLLARQPLRWIGQRSYGIYLWHWPIFTLLRPGFELADEPMMALALRIALTFAAAEMSYRFVEDPIRSGRIAFWAWPRKAALTAMVGVGFAASVMVYLHPEAPDEVAEDVVLAMGLREAPRDTASQNTASSPVPSNAAGDDVSGDPVGSACLPTCSSKPPAGRVVERAEEHDGTLPARPIEPGPDGSLLTAIGDSVLLGTRTHLTAAIAGVHVDAEIGRQGHQGLKRVRELKAQGRLAPAVLIHLGTNGYLTEPHVRTLLGELADRREVLLVNVRAPRRWVPYNNELLQHVKGEFPNVVLVDWDALSAGHPEYFVSDGVHLTSAGMRALTDEIKRVGGLPAPQAVAHSGPTPAVGDASRRTRYVSRSDASNPSDRTVHENELATAKSPSSVSGDANFAAPSAALTSKHVETLAAIAGPGYVEARYVLEARPAAIDRHPSAVPNGP